MGTTRTILLCTILLAWTASMLNASNITITKPAAGEHYCIGGENLPMNIKWTKTGTMPPHVKIDLCNSSGTNVLQMVVANTENDGEHTWATYAPFTIAPGTYTIRITTAQEFPFNVVVGTSAPFVFETCNIPSPITVIAPGEGAVLYKGSTYVIRWQVGKPPPYEYFHTRVKLQLWGSTQNPTDNSTNFATADTNACEYTWTVPTSVSPGLYKIWLVTQMPVAGSSGVFRIKEKFNIDWLKEILLQVDYFLWWQNGPKPPIEFDLSKMKQLFAKGQEKIQIELAYNQQMVSKLGVFGPGASGESTLSLPVVSTSLNKAFKSGQGFILVIRNMQGEELYRHPIKLQERK